MLQYTFVHSDHACAYSSAGLHHHLFLAPPHPQVVSGAFALSQIKMVVVCSMLAFVYAIVDAIACVAAQRGRLVGLWRTACVVLAVVRYNVEDGLMNKVALECVLVLSVCRSLDDKSFAALVVWLDSLALARVPTEHVACHDEARSYRSI